MHIYMPVYTQPKSGKIIYFSYFENIFSIKSGCLINLLDYIGVSVLVFPLSFIILSADYKKCYHLVG